MTALVRLENYYGTYANSAEPVQMLQNVALFANRNFYAKYNKTENIHQKTLKLDKYTSQKRVRYFGHLGGG